MKIIIAPDSFKGSLTTIVAADAIADGIRAVVPEAEIISIPIADGGEGTVEALIRASNGKIVKTPATDPLGNKIESFFGILGDGQTAVIEMAAASGLPLVPNDKRNPMLTTTYGTGELIKAALDYGCRKIIMGIGGSGTNDGGIGAIQALQGSFKDANGWELKHGGAELIHLKTIDLSKLDKRIADCKFVVACDVTNPLTGELGAAAVFGPQKGANHEMIKSLDAGLHNMASVIKSELGINVEDVPGAGAAGGLGAACLAFLGAELKSGIDIVLDAVDFNNKLNGADLVITGEGRVDSQTINGKVVSGILRASNTRNVPLLVIGGGVEEDGYELLDYGAIAVLSICNKPMSLDYAQANAKELLTRCAEQAMRMIVFK